jgi:hypothetical protein
MRGYELQEIMDAIEGSKSTLNKLVSLRGKDLSSEETLRASRELDELLNMYNTFFQDRTEGFQETAELFLDEDSSYE